MGHLQSYIHIKQTTLVVDFAGQQTLIIAGQIMVPLY